MPTAYEQLLIEAAPKVIETEQEYEAIGHRFGDLVGKGRARTPAETKLMRLLGPVDSGLRPPARHAPG